MHLNSRGITIDQIKKSFEIRSSIMKLLDKESINFDKEDKQLFFDANDIAFQEYIDGLIDNSKIEIFQENIDKLVLEGFEETGDDLCNKEKPVVRLYTTSFCDVCKESGNVFENLVEEFVKDGSISAVHWSLDAGDDLLTSKKENGVPKEEVAIFKKYSPDKLVPAAVLGCKYQRIGKLGIEEQNEFKNILKVLIGE